MVPSFGHIVNINEVDKNKVVHNLLFRSMRLTSGGSRGEPFMPDPKISTPPDMLPSASKRLLKSPWPVSTSMTMSKGQDSAEDWASDHSSKIIFILYPLLKSTINSLLDIFLLNIYIKLMKALVCALMLAVFASALKTDKHPEANLQIMDYCRHFKYPIESHKVTT